MDLSNLSREELEVSSRDSIYRTRIFWITVLGYSILNVIFPEVGHGGAAKIFTGIIFLIIWGIYVFRYMPTPKRLKEVNEVDK